MPAPRATRDMAPALRARVPARVALALLLIGLFIAFVPGLAAGNGFMPRAWVSSGSIQIALPMASGQSQRFATATGDELTIDTTGGVLTIRGKTSINLTGSWFAPSSLTDLALAEPGWAAAVAALLAMAPLYAWWRRGSLSFGRVLGAATGVVAAAAVCAMAIDSAHDLSTVTSGEWWTVPLGALLMGAAFVVAPEPVRRSED